MSEPIDRKRGWWSRLVGADGERPDELIQQLAQELTELRELADQLAAQRDEALAANEKRAKSDAAILSRARSETEQVRRAAEAQSAGLRAQLESLRREQVEERARREQLQRDAHARERDLRAMTATQQRGASTLARDLAAARHVLEQEQARAAQLNEELVAARLLHAQHDEARRAAVAAREELVAFRTLALEALRIAVGEHGAELALAVARRAVPDTP